MGLETIVLFGRAIMGQGLFPFPKLMQTDSGPGINIGGLDLLADQQE
jgi:hypothetical protein